MKFGDGPKRFIFKMQGCFETFRTVPNVSGPSPVFHGIIGIDFKR